jgi:hypothetical protein
MIENHCLFGFLNSKYRVGRIQLKKKKNECTQLISLGPKIRHLLRP